MTPIRCCTVACALCLGQSALGSIVNGGFEPAPGVPDYVMVPGGSTAIDGWTTTDTGVEWFRPSAFGLTDSPDGGWVVDLANIDQSAGGIEQTFTTVLGTPYQVDFLYGTMQASGRDGTAEIIVAAGGTSELFSIVNTTGDIVWESRSFSFIADSTSTTLWFRNLQDANLHFANIDGVSMTVVPAPGTAFMALAAGIAVLRSRKR